MLIFKTKHMQIADKTVVALRYLMLNQQGETIENTMEGPSVEYLHGSGSILPQLETNLNGLSCGERKKFSFTDSSIGDIHFDIVIDSVRMADEEELKAGRPAGAEKANVDGCGPDCCC
jgi:FKBP-type peptidyl-prolyl cis-trans isomerase SlyD